MKKRFSVWHFLAIVFLLPFAAYGAMVWYENKFTKLPVYGAEEIKDGKKIIHRIQDFELVNQDGLKQGSEALNGKIAVVDFFFTHCPSICPKMTASLKRVQQAFGDDNAVIINSISVDPERDSVAQLKKYVNRFGINTANWSLLTGDKKEIYKLARNEFMIVATDGDGGAEDFIHSEKLVLADQQKRIRGYYDGTNKKQVDQLIHDIKKLENE